MNEYVKNTIESHIRLSISYADVMKTITPHEIEMMGSGHVEEMLRAECIVFSGTGTIIRVLSKVRAEIKKKTKGIKRVKE